MKGRLFVLSACLLTLVASLAYVRTRFLLVELSYEIGQKKAEKAMLEQERRELTLELATLQRPARIEKLAKNDLKLTRPASTVPTVDLRGGTAK